MYYSRRDPVEAMQVVMDPEWGNFGKVDDWLKKQEQVKEVYVLTEGGVPEGLYFTYDLDDFSDEIQTDVAKRGQWIVKSYRDSFTIYDDQDFRERYVEGVDQ